MIGARRSAFTVEQWLRADGDERSPYDPDLGIGRCDKLGCAATLADGRSVVIVTEALAFEDDCARADIIITPLWAPAYCKARLIIDRNVLARSGAVALTFGPDRIAVKPARTTTEDRPWSPRPTDDRRVPYR